MGRRSNRPRSKGFRVSDRSTVGLALVAIGTLGTVAGGEIVRLVRRRRASSEVPTPGSFLDAAELATRDVLSVARQGYTRGSRSEVRLFNMLNGFVGAFALARLSTLGIRHGWWPAGNVRVGDRHIHHFVPGIVIALLSGGAAIATASERLEEVLSVAFGAGAGLTFDEAALLLDLRDVYWSREGILSVQLSLGLTAVLGATILGLRMFRRGERESLEEGLIPSLAHDTGALAATGSIR